MDRKFVNRVEKACDLALVQNGFERPRAGTRFFRLNEDFLGWVGLNKGNHADFLRINPFIGIHCIPVMKLKAELAGEKYKEGNFATVSIHMGEIAPEIDQFIFTSDTDIEQEANRLAREIVTHALPWMRSRANFEAIIPLLKEKVEMLGGYPERYALALYLSGSTEKAKNFVLERTDIFDPNYDGPYSLCEKFGKPFLEMLEGEEGCKGGKARCCR